MRIYTEVNFQWNDKKGKLVEVSSDSFDYSGEMALCIEWDYWKTIWYDDAGNAYQLRVHLNSWNNKVDVADVMKSTDGGSTWTKDKEQLNDGKNMKKSTAHSKFKNYVKGKSTSGKAHGKKGLDDGGDAVDQHWLSTYFVERPPSTSDAAEQMGRYDSAEWTYAEGAWRNIAEEGFVDDPRWTEDTETGTWTYTEDPEDPEDPGDPTRALSEDEAKRGAQLAIEGYIDTWKKIVDPDIEDAAQTIIEGYGRDLKEKEEDVRTAYEDIFGEEGTIFDIEKTWETDVERAGTKYTKDIGLAETEREEGLETTVTGREGELEALRGEAGENIRAAEAKIGAAGFASTGVGQTARDVLAKEIGGAARDIDEGFTEERSDVKRQYLETVDPLEEKFGAEGTAYEDYIRDRDLAAKGVLKSWQAASTAYERAETAYEAEHQATARFGYEEKLAETGGLISSAILDITQGLGTEDPIDPAWDPFATDYLRGYTAEQFGIDPTTMEFRGIPTAGELDIFAEPFYTPYEVDPGLELYDPEKLLPWEEGYGKAELKTQDPEKYTPPTLTMSDIAVKKDITRISKLKNGIPVYLFRYKWSNKMNVGVMAQDVEKIIPDAVVEINGIKAVNYSMLNKEE